MPESWFRCCFLSVFLLNVVYYKKNDSLKTKIQEWPTYSFIKSDRTSRSSGWHSYYVLRRNCVHISAWKPVIYGVSWILYAYASIELDIRSRQLLSTSSPIHYLLTILYRGRLRSSRKSFGLSGERDTGNISRCARSNTWRSRQVGKQITNKTPPDNKKYSK
jgi:hypothetical protein